MQTPRIGIMGIIICRGTAQKATKIRGTTTISISIDYLNLEGTPAVHLSEILLAKLRLVRTNIFWGRFY
jgi:hypothetical protein